MFTKITVRSRKVGWIHVLGTREYCGRCVQQKPKHKSQKIVLIIFEKRATSFSFLVYFFPTAYTDCTLTNDIHKTVQLRWRNMPKRRHYAPYQQLGLGTRTSKTHTAPYRGKLVSIQCLIVAAVPPKFFSTCCHDSSVIKVGVSLGSKSFFQVSPVLSRVKTN